MQYKTRTSIDEHAPSCHSSAPVSHTFFLFDGKWALILAMWGLREKNEHPQANGLLIMAHNWNVVFSSQKYISIYVVDTLTLTLMAAWIAYCLAFIKCMMGLCSSSMVDLAYIFRLCCDGRLQLIEIQNFEAHTEQFSTQKMLTLLTTTGIVCWICGNFEHLERAEQKSCDNNREPRLIRTYDGNKLLCCMQRPTNNGWYMQHGKAMHYNFFQQYFWSNGTTVVRWRRLFILSNLSISLLFISLNVLHLNQLPHQIVCLCFFNYCPL